MTDGPVAARPGADLVVRGGTVVTSRRAAAADVAVRDGRIAAVGPGLAVGAHEVVDATGLLVLPGAVDVHTHTRVATETEPDRFYRDSVAAALGGTTTFLAFNNPGTGSSAGAERSVLAGLREWRSATEHDSAIDYALSIALSGRMDDPVAELPAMVDAGVPTAKAFMVFDFRLDDVRLFEAMGVLGARGGMLQVHCEDPVIVDAAVAGHLARGEIGPRFHAVSRPAYAEGVATARAIAFARASDAPIHIVHLSSEEALRHVRSARSIGLRVSAETCPHYLALTDERYGAEDAVEVAEVVISPPLRRPADREALWVGLAAGDLEMVATDHVPDRAGVEKAEAAHGVPFDRISNGAPGIETLLAVTYGLGVGRGRLSPERLVDLLSTSPARRFGLHRKGAIEVGRDADLVIFDPAPRRTIRAADLHHTSDYTPFEGLEVSGTVRSVYLRGRAIVRDGAFTGDRGYGRFVGRDRAGE
jgi:dihydropyrimidinase